MLHATWCCCLCRQRTCPGGGGGGCSRHHEFKHPLFEEPHPPVGLTVYLYPPPPPPPSHFSFPEPIYHRFPQWRTLGQVPTREKTIAMEEMPAPEQSAAECKTKNEKLVSEIPFKPDLPADALGQDEQIAKVGEVMGVIGAMTVVQGDENGDAVDTDTVQHSCSSTHPRLSPGCPPAVPRLSPVLSSNGDRACSAPCCWLRLFSLGHCCHHRGPNFKSSFLHSRFATCTPVFAL